MTTATLDIDDLLAALAAKDAENSRLRGQLDAMRAELAAVRAEAQARSSELLVQVAKLTDRVNELLVIAQRKKRGEPSLPPPALAPATLDAAAAGTFDGRPTAPEAPGPMHDHPRPKQRPTGRKPLPDHLPVDESTARPTACEQCGSDNLEDIDEEIEDKLDIQAHQRVRRRRRKVCRCRKCGERTTAEASPAPIAGSKATIRWVSWLAVEKFVKHVPLDRVRRYLGAQGLALSISYLVSQIELVADLLDIVDGEHWRHLRRGGLIESDGTGLKVIVPGVGVHHGHLEVYRHDGVVVFQYEAEKGGETQAAKLNGFVGFLLVDAESRYNRTFAEHTNIVEVGCNGHGFRKFEDAEKTQPKLADEGGRFISRWFALDDEARQNGLTGDALHEWRQVRIRPLVEQFRKWMDAVEPVLTLSDPLAKAIRYYRNHWAALTRFLDHPELPLSNNGCEREFQAVAKLRLNSMFAGGTEGAHRAAVLLGIAATCRHLGVDMQAYLEWAIERLGTHRAKFAMRADQLTPKAYKATRAA